MPPSVCFAAYSAGEIVERIRNDPCFKPTLGIIFSSVDIGIPELSSAAASLGIPLFGASTAGEILPLPGEPAPVLEQSAVCCFVNPDPSVFSVALFERGDDSAADLGNRIGAWGLQAFSDPAFVIAISGLKNDGEAIVRGIEAACPPKTPVFGGMSGDDGNFQETFVFSHTGYSADGAVVIVFDRSAVSIDGIASSGWVGVGTEMVVTSSEGNVVHAINNRPAAEIFKDYLKVNDKMLLKVGITFPLLVRRPDGTEVLRAFISVDPSTGSLYFAGSVPQGAKVRFSSSFGYETIERSIRTLREFHAGHRKASLILLFSCIARHRVAGPAVSDEIRAVSSLWDAPVIGFFTYGEIGYNREGTCDFYNETLSLVRVDFTREPV